MSDMATVRGDEGFLLFGVRNEAWRNSKRFWPENGLVCWVDKVSGEYDACTPETMLERMHTLAALIGTKESPGIERDNNDRAMLRRYLDAMVLRVIPEARRQGSPSDQSCYNSRVDALPKTFLMGTNYAPLLG
jgi:hypothetical protein